MKQSKRQCVSRRWISDVLGCLLVVAAPVGYVLAATEAPAGFDNGTNGFELQPNMDADRVMHFDEVEDIAKGLGPVYNAQACRECHQNPVSGATSQVSELRVGRLDSAGNFVDRPGGSLINDRAIDASIQERVDPADTVVAFRASLNILGDGFVEAIADGTFTTIQNGQPAGMKGQIISVPLLEAPGQTRVARFGWKNQHASLLSFAADAYLNEMGITSPLQPNENTSNGNSVAAFDTVPDPEDPATSADPFGTDVGAFVRFMRSTKVPPRDTALAATPNAVAGASLFDSIGCSICHVTSITTAPAGTVINGGTFTVPPDLGDKIIHPYSDFMLHNVGTGDRIVQNGGQSTAQDINFANCQGQLPTAPLPASFVSHLQTSLTGQFSSLLGGCAGLAYGDNIARGYVTVDTVNNCTLRFPGDTSYFAAGGTGDATDQNVLLGDYNYVNSATNRADGNTMVHIHADPNDPQLTSSGQYTFYGRYVNWTAIDNREPLATNFFARFLSGGPFSGGTSMIAWRDPKIRQGAFKCGTVPAWYPLGETKIIIFDEQEHPSIPQTLPVSPQPPQSGIIPFPAAAQSTAVGGAAFPVPYKFGWVFYDLNSQVTPAGSVPPNDPQAQQAWMTIVMTSLGRYSVGYPAFQLDTARDRFRGCPPNVFFKGGQ